MPRTTRTLDLDAEAERLNSDLDGLVDKAIGLDEDSDMFATVTQEAQQLEQYLVGVLWATDPPVDDDGVPEHEPYEEVTIGALTTGEYGQWADRVSDAQQEAVGRRGTSAAGGPSLVFFVASGLVDAPFVDDRSFDARAAAVRDLAPQFARYLEDRIDDLTTPDVDFPERFAERVAARRTQQS